MSRLLLRPATSLSTASRVFLSLPPSSRTAAFSVLNRPPPNYPGHVPLTFLERAGLAVGSALMSMADHYRHGTTPFPISFATSNNAQTWLRP